MKANQPLNTSIKCARREGQELFTRVDTYENGVISELIMEHLSQDGKEFLEVNATGFTGKLTNPMLSQYMKEMNRDLRPSDVTSLKLVGLTENNCEADLFRRQVESYIMDGSFSKLKEVVFECGYSPEDIEKYGIQPSTLPARPFLKGELDFVKFDGQQIIPDNFLTNAYEVGTVICPDNNNTHAFLTSENFDKEITLIKPDQATQIASAQPVQE